MRGRERGNAAGATDAMHDKGGAVTAPGGGKAHTGRGREAMRLLAGLTDFGLEQAEGLPPDPLQVPR